MRCPNCNSLRPDSEQFCGQCGNSFWRSEPGERADLKSDPSLHLPSRFSLKSLLFSFHGRINRTMFWAGNICITVVLYGGFALLIIIVGGGGGPDTDAVQPGGVLVFLPLIIVLIFGWMSFSVQVKRWHNRNKSGWWVFIGLVPIVQLWALVELGFLRGTNGQNRFGPDPLRKVSEISELTSA